MDAQQIAKYEALGWKLLRWKDRKGNDCSGWRSPEGKQCAVPPTDGGPMESDAEYYARQLGEDEQEQDKAALDRHRNIQLTDRE